MRDVVAHVGGSDRRHPAPAEERLQMFDAVLEVIDRVVVIPHVIVDDVRDGVVEAQAPDFRVDGHAAIDVGLAAAHQFFRFGFIAGVAALDHRHAVPVVLHHPVVATVRLSVQVSHARPPFELGDKTSTTRFVTMPQAMKTTSVLLGASVSARISATSIGTNARTRASSMASSGSSSSLGGTYGGSVTMAARSAAARCRRTAYRPSAPRPGARR